MNYRNKGFKGKKKVDIYKWLSGENTLIYSIILVLFLAALVFVLFSVISMHNDNKNRQDNDYEETSKEIKTENYNTKDNTESTFLAKNKSYYIKVGIAEHTLIVYQIDKDKNIIDVEKAFKVGISDNVKPVMTKIREKSFWKNFNDYLFGHYATILDNQDYFSSAAYYSLDVYNLNPNSYNNIGNSITEGSIIMTASNAKWIYENCGIDTVVEIVESVSLDNINVEEFEKISYSSYADPMDMKTNA